MRRAASKPIPAPAAIIRMDKPPKIAACAPVRANVGGTFGCIGGRVVAGATGIVGGLLGGFVVSDSTGGGGGVVDELGGVVPGVYGVPGVPGVCGGCFGFTTFTVCEASSRSS